MTDRIVKLEELALAELEVCDDQGWVTTRTMVDPCKLMRLRKAIAALGREALSSFMGWLMSDQGFSEKTSSAIVRRVWCAMYEHGGDMAAKLDDETLSWSYRKKIHGDLRKFAAYLCNSEGDSDRELGEDLLEGLAKPQFWRSPPGAGLIYRYRPQKGRVRRGGRGRA